MKSVGWVVIMLGLLGVGYLSVRDLQVVEGRRDGRVVVNPIEKAKDAARLLDETQKSLKDSLDAIQR